jgi:large subunit ribosomal protein L21
MGRGLRLRLKSETLKREEMLMKHAIIVTGGKQYRVAEGDVIFVEKLDVAAGEAVKFDQVLAVIDGETAVFGAPVIEGASVSANVVKSGKSAKIRVYKMKPKKGYRRTQGHRQPYTKVQIETINA